MSFSITTEQFLDGTKTVTRRLGWKFLKSGDHVMAVEKAMGLRKGEKIKRLGEIEIVSVWRERLGNITRADVIKEGFSMTGPEFVAMFCEHMGCTPDTLVNRIEFRRVRT